MKTEHLYRALSRTLVFFWAGLLLAGCGGLSPEGTDPETKSEITVDVSSLDVFTSGITVEADPSGGVYSRQVLFFTTDQWTATLSGTEPLDWITIQPTSGAAGTASMKVSVVSNESESERTAEVTITCGEAKKSFRVMQEGKTTVIEPAVVDVSNPTLSGITVDSFNPTERTLEITVEEGKEPKVGDILCSEPTAVAPYGFMVKVAGIQDISTRIYTERRLLLAYTDLAIYEICKVEGITEPGWYTLFEKDVSCTDEDGNVIVPEPKTGPKVVSKVVPMSFSDVIKFEYKFDFSIQSIEIYLDPSEINVKTGLRATLKTTEVLHADLKGKAEKKGAFFKNASKSLTVKHNFKLFPFVYVTTMFKPSIPYELSLSGDLDMDIYRRTTYHCIEFYYDILYDRILKDSSRGIYYQTPAPEEDAVFYDPDDRTVSAKLEGALSVGMDFEFSAGLWGGNAIEEGEYEGHLIQHSKYLSLGINLGAKLQDKASLGIQVNLNEDSHNAVRAIDENKLSLYAYGKVWGTAYKGKIAGQGVEFGSAEAEIKLDMVEWSKPFLFRDWHKLKVDSVTPQGRIRITGKEALPIVHCFKESGYGLCLESGDGMDYWAFDLTDIPISGNEGGVGGAGSGGGGGGGDSWGEMVYEIPLPIGNLRRNVKYSIYPYSLISNIPFVEGTKMVCRKGISFVVTDDGKLVTSVIDDIPGEVL